jgi:hypothetical protein
VTKTRTWVTEIGRSVNAMLADIGRPDLLLRALQYALSEARLLDVEDELDGLAPQLREQQVLNSACWAVLAALFDGLGLPGPTLASAKMVEHFQPTAGDPLAVVMTAAAEYFLEHAHDPQGAERRVRVREHRLLPQVADHLDHDPKEGSTK